MRSILKVRWNFEFGFDRNGVCQGYFMSTRLLHVIEKNIGWFPHPKYFEHPNKDCWRPNRRNSELNQFTVPTMAVWHYFHLVIEPDELDRSWQIWRIMKISISHFLRSVRCLTAWQFRLLDTARLTITFILNFNYFLLISGVWNAFLPINSGYIIV